MKKKHNTTTLGDGVKLYYERRFKKKELWLHSDNFLKRAFSIMWHNLVAVMIVYLIVFVIILIISGLYI